MRGEGVRRERPRRAGLAAECTPLHVSCAATRQNAPRLDLELASLPHQPICQNERTLSCHAREHAGGRGRGKSEHGRRHDQQETRPVDLPSRATSAASDVASLSSDTPYSCFAWAHIYTRVGQIAVRIRA